MEQKKQMGMMHMQQKAIDVFKLKVFLGYRVRQGFASGCFKLKKNRLIDPEVTVKFSVARVLKRGYSLLIVRDLFHVVWLHDFRVIN